MFVHIQKDFLAVKKAKIVSYIDFQAIDEEEFQKTKAVQADNSDFDILSYKTDLSPKGN